MLPRFQAMLHTFLKFQDTFYTESFLITAYDSNGMVLRGLLCDSAVCENC